jgi:hypothetical protein
LLIDGWKSRFFPELPRSLKSSFLSKALTWLSMPNLSLSQIGQHEFADEGHGPFCGK